MSFEWQSLRRSSLLGPKSGLSLNQSQQILRMNEMKQKSRRVSLIANFGSNHKSGLTLTTDLAPLENSTQLRQRSVETLSQQSSQTNCAPIESSTDSTNPSKTSKTVNRLTENQIQCKTNWTQSVVNNSINSNINTNTNTNSNSINNNNTNSGNTSALSVSSMLPTINYDNIVMSRSSIDMSGRMSRRSSKSTAESFTCSQQSILSAMDRFVKCVNNMDATVLVPSKLRDMDIPSAKVVRIPPALANTDLHSFYQMLNEVKKELLWGPGTQHNQTANVIPLSGRSSPRDLKHIRQPSDDSLGSLGSTTSSSSDQDTDSEADSLMTDRDSIDEHTSHLSAAFRHHLQGLHTILHQLADSADYLSSRYQEDIDASSL